MKKLFTLTLTLVLCAALLIGCGAPTNNTAHDDSHIHMEEILIPAPTVKAAGGVLSLKINPEIALHYDENGKVTKVEGRNADGTRILEGFTGYTGKDTAQVLEELVDLIGKAGYFVEEADGTSRRIVLELDPGSQLPHDQFLQDMAKHVKSCVENKNWVGEKEYDYPETQPTVAPADITPTEPADIIPTEPEPTEPAPTTKNTTSSTKKSTSTVPSGLCPVCADDDCNDGKYCDDADEKAENLREYERLMSGEVCSVCGDYDCDDGKYCDDAHEKERNLKEAEAKREKLSSGSTSASKTSSSSSSSSTTKKTSSSSGLCPVCADDDCDDGKYCDDADEKAENLREAENRKNGVRCSVCGDYDCDDGKYCDDWDDRYDHDD